MLILPLCTRCNRSYMFASRIPGVCLPCERTERLEKENKAMGKLLADVVNSPVAQAERILAGKETK